MFAEKLQKILDFIIFVLEFKENMFNYYKKTIVHLVIWVICFFSYNAYFGFNLKPVGFSEALCDFISQIQFGFVVLMFLHERDTFIYNDFLKDTEKVLENYYLIKKETLDICEVKKQEV